MNDAEKLEQSDVLKKRAGELFKVRRFTLINPKRDRPDMT
jgi:hypothetical protein